PQISLGGKPMAPTLLRRRRWQVGLLAGAALIVTAAAGAPALAAPDRHVIPGSEPRWLSHAKSLGSATATDQVSFGLLLKMRDQAGAASTLADISDPASANYG